jgi:DNA transformation protein and related proteins
MNRLKGDRLYVALGASQARRRLKGHGFGVRKIESAGKGRALIIHTATGPSRRKLHALFADVFESDSGVEETDSGR